jgi:hypothetical protein
MGPFTKLFGDLLVFDAWPASFTVAASRRSVAASKSCRILIATLISASRIKNSGKANHAVINNPSRVMAFEMWYYMSRSTCGTVLASRQLPANT